MRILVHDYSSQPFQIQLSRALAARGHEVHHLHASFLQTPGGPHTRHADDPSSLRIVGLELGVGFAKYAFVKRIRQEMRYGRLLTREVARIRPDVVISSNTPLDPQARLARACRDAGAGFVFWLQDITAVAIDRIMRRRMPVLGAAIGARYLKLERRLLRDADAVVAITADFLPILDDWGVARERVAVIENWAPLDDMPTHPRRNGWSTEHGLDGKKVFLYSGTLGLKHNPALLLALAHRMSNRPDSRVVVISEGPGADWLSTHKDSLPIDNLLLLPYQPFARMPEVLASADVLTATLEADAGVFSVSSKVLSYLCAKRPILAAMPPENLSARTIVRASAGIVVGPGDEKGFCDSAERLAADPDLCRRLGEAARVHAETYFRIGDIADRFERLCEKVKADYVLP